MTTAITRTMCQSFRSDFSKAVQDLEKKYGVKIGLGNISYDESEIRTKMTVVLASKTVAQAPVTGGLPLEAKIGVRFKLPGKRNIFTITGFNPRAPKFNLRVTTDGGTAYRMPASVLERAVVL